MTALTPQPAVNALLKGLQRQLGRARSNKTRSRLSEAIRYITRLYGLPSKPDTARDLDLKRRERFTRARHVIRRDHH
jgi:hypothetical protein